MKLYNSIGPNPRVVRMFMHEKGIEMPMQEIDIRAGENRQEPYVKSVNPSGQCPALELDDGHIITETTAICEYLEDTHPDKPLIGRNPLEKAETRMWTRRVDLRICEPMLNAFRFGPGIKMFQNRVHCIPQASDDLAATAAENLAWLDGLMDGREWIAGDRFSLADIVLFCVVDFGATVGQPIAPELKNVTRWHQAAKARPSAAA